MWVLIVMFAAADPSTGEMKSSSEMRAMPSYEACAAARDAVARQPVRDGAMRLAKCEQRSGRV